MGTEALLVGRYRLEHVAGHGGMATVFKAYDTVLDRTVAIKLLARRHGAPGIVEARFQREARAEAKIVHPNVVSVHDIGESEDGRPFIVMDYVEGASLQTVIAEQGPMSSEQVAILGAGLARALAAAHTLGIMHRDVKPANVIIDAQGIPHLMDFGLARELNDEDPGMTAPGVMVGTPHYIAPEQARYGTASPAADLYSLGAVLYQALTGEPPFTGDGAIDVALRRFEEDPAALRDLLPAADADLTSLIHTLLMRDPVERPWDASSVAERLGDIAARLRATRTAGETQAPL
jgi:serine/threonine protein kinase